MYLRCFFRVTGNLVTSHVTYSFQDVKTLRIHFFLFLGAKPCESFSCFSEFFVFFSSKVLGETEKKVIMFSFCMDIIFYEL